MIKNIQIQPQQLRLEFMQGVPEPSYRAIWFYLGQYNADDTKDHCLQGKDCPFEDSKIILAETQDELATIVQKVLSGEHEGVALFDCPPDVIVDQNNNLRPEIYERVCGIRPASTYSWGRETAEEFWKREGWRFTEKTN